MRRKVQDELEEALAIVTREISYPGANSSLAHGFAGVGEALLLGDSMLGAPDQLVPDPLARSRRLAEIALAHLPALEWPSGTPCSGPNPSLLLGLSGLGDWLLRLTNHPAAWRWMPLAPMGLNTIHGTIDNGQLSRDRTQERR